MSATTLSTHPIFMHTAAGNNNLSTCLSIREKALEMFAEHGFQAVSLRKLAGAIGIQPGSLYCHINNKHALLFELIEEHEDDLLESLKTAIPSGPPNIQLKAYIWENLTYLTQHHRQATVAKHETRHLREEQRSSIRTLKNKRHLLLKDILKNHANQKGKQNREDLQIICQCVTTIMDNIFECSLPPSIDLLHAYHDFICRYIDDRLNRHNKTLS